MIYAVWVDTLGVRPEACWHICVALRQVQGFILIHIGRELCSCRSAMSQVFGVHVCIAT